MLFAIDDARQAITRGQLEGALFSGGPCFAEGWGRESFVEMLWNWFPCPATDNLHTTCMVRKYSDMAKVNLPFFKYVVRRSRLDVCLEVVMDTLIVGRT